MTRSITTSSVVVKNYKGLNDEVAARLCRFACKETSPSEAGGGGIFYLIFFFSRVTIGIKIRPAKIKNKGTLA